MINKVAMQYYDRRHWMYLRWYFTVCKQSNAMCSPLNIIGEYSTLNIQQTAVEISRFILADQVPVVQKLFKPDLS